MTDLVLLPTKVEKVVDPSVDLGNLLLTDNDPPPADNPDKVPSEEELLEKARENTQYLFNKIWELERERVDEAICAKLPAPHLKLPREKVLPEKRRLTKWESYAQEKGIRKKTKDAKVYDEATKEWKPTYGYRRGKDDTKDWMIEIPDHKDPMVDYYEERTGTKKERVHKNELQRLRNIGRSMKARGGASAEDDGKPLGLSTDFEARTKHELVNQMDRAKQATASLGKYQPGLKDEKAPKKTGKTHKFGANEASVSNERKRHMEILDRLGSKKPALNESRLAASQEISRPPSQGGNKNRNERGDHRHKSAVHRQQHFQSKLKLGKRGGGPGAKRGGGATGKRGGKMGKSTRK